MPTLSDLPLELFRCVVSTYIQDADIPEIFRVRAVSRTFAKVIIEELLFNGAKTVDNIKVIRQGRHVSFNEGAVKPNGFLENNAVTVLYHWVQRRLRTKPLLPKYIGAIADDLIRGTKNAVREFHYTSLEVTEIRNAFVQELCHTFVKLNPGQIWYDLDKSPERGYSRSVHKSLAIAACVGHTGAMHYFLNRGADPFQLEPDSFRNPFKTAACTGKVKALRLLIASATQKPEPSSEETTSERDIQIRLEILQDAIEIAVKGHHDESALLIKDFALTQCTPVNVEALNKQCTEIAVRHGHVQLLQSLLEDDKPIAATIPARSHMTIEHIKTACKMGHVELIRYLLQTNLINSTMFRSDTQNDCFNLLRVALRYGQCGMVDLFYETGARPLPKHLIVAFAKGKKQTAFVMVRHLTKSALVLHKGATVICNDLAKLTLHYGRNDCSYKPSFTRRRNDDRVMAVLFLATELKKQRLLDLSQDMKGLFDLCEYALSDRTKVSNTPLPFVEMAKSIRGWLKRKVPMFQPRSTRVLRSHTQDTT